MNPNYPSSSEVIRNISEIRTPHEVLETRGRFRLIRFEKPFFGGYEFWIINEKGFMWEPADNVDSALEYLKSDEALDYNRSPI